MVFVHGFISQRTELFSDLLQGVKVTLEIEKDQAAQNIFMPAPSSHFNVALLTLWQGSRQNLSLRPCLSDITQGPATTWRLMMATSTAIHFLVKTENNCLTGVSHIPFHIPCVFIKSPNGAPGWTKGKRKKTTDWRSVLRSSLEEISSSKQS